MRTYYMQRPQTALFLIVSYSMWAAVSLRWIQELIEAGLPQLWLIASILLLFGILMGLEPWLTGGSAVRAHLYLAFQTALVLFASLFHNELDFFAILYIPLCGQAMFLFPRRTTLIWVGILILATFIGQMIQFGWPESLSFTLLYVGGLVFVAAYSNLTIQASASRERSDQLLAELQDAHRQLLAYAEQAEELTAVRERNRLARDLHDSVAQTLYGLTLQSEAASRRLGAGQVDLAEEYLGQLRKSVQQTLQEIRLLIFELLPPVFEKAALRARLDAVEKRSGIRVKMNFDKLGKLPPRVGAELFRVAQEALNNTLKHAEASEVRVSIQEQDHNLCLEIDDNGIGFDPVQIQSQGGLGLSGMRERVKGIGGQLSIASTPGEGTQIKVTVPR